MKVIVVKIGGSVISDKNDKFSLDEGLLEDLVEEMSSIDRKLLLVHGGGSFGHPLASEYDIPGGYSREEQLMGFSKTHRAMRKLNSKFLDAFLERDRPAVSMQTSACTSVKNGEIVSMEVENIRKLLELGVVPILYGDSVLDLEKGFDILSGDQIVSYLSKKLGPEKVIFGADTKGVFTGDPKEDRNAELIPKITPELWKKMEPFLDVSSEKDVTGGMENKINVCLDLAKDGIESKIIDATNPKNLRKAILTDKRVGTKISKE